LKAAQENLKGLDLPDLRTIVGQLENCPDTIVEFIRTQTRWGDKHE